MWISIWNSEISTATGIYCGSRKLRPWDSSRLPSGYQEVEYIESNWTQYINTWITLAWKLLTTKAKFNVTQSWTWEAKCAWISYSSWRYCYQLYSNDNYVRFYALNNDTSVSDKTRNTPVWNRGAIIETTITQTWYITWDAANLNFTLFARNYNNSIEKWSLRIYYWQMTLDGTLVRDFVPCYKKSDTEIWLYDLVGKQFYTNSWTWTFTKWGDVN